MSQGKMKGKGQLSFDLGFAIVLVLMVLTILIEYTNTASGTVEDGSKLMALNMIADYAAGNLQSFYNSLVGTEAEATYLLDMTDAHLYAPAGQAAQQDVVYEMSFSGGKISVSDTADMSLSGEEISRELGFRIRCPGLGTASPGDRITFNGCAAEGGSLSCERCGIE